MATQPPPAPAILAAKRDADLAWPSRSIASDGMSGDQAHLDRCTLQGNCEGHVEGNAIDITTDPEHGANNRELAELALTDKRTAYVISNGEIATSKFNVASPWAGKGWRHYDGPNKHDHHTHISVRPEMRSDASPWPWHPSLINKRASGLPRQAKIVAAVASVSTGLYYLGKAVFKW